MNRDDVQKLRDRVKEALPDCDVFILDRGFGIGYVVTVEKQPPLQWEAVVERDSERRREAK